ncbi:MAG: ATP-binding cassette domain-containing protein [candidate division KSB1 bacterium]|nr:ATP-binding cassette domain-containing protein [candidate division KSB1 bacterium]
MPLSLELKNVSFRYEDWSETDVWVLNKINLLFGANECTALVGPSGAGKTTLVQHFTGLLKPSGGQVLFENKDIWNKSFSRSRLFKEIGLVFQFPESQLFEETVRDDVAYGPKNLQLDDETINHRVYESLEMLGIDPKTFAERSPFQLSEGEKRRVAIAGILAMQPQMIVFDEPTAGLDPAGVRQFVSLIQTLIASGKSIVIISHNMDFVAQVADRVIVLKSGSVLFDGTCPDLFDDDHLLKTADLERPGIQTAVLELGIQLPVKLSSVLTLQDLEQLLSRL